MPGTLTAWKDTPTQKLDGGDRAIRVRRDLDGLHQLTKTLLGMGGQAVARPRPADRPELAICHAALEGPRPPESQPRSGQPATTRLRTGYNALWKLVTRASSQRIAR